MEYGFFIDQLALKRWFGKIDATDALLIGFVRGLNPHNDAVARRMKDGLFELSREWILGEIPILTVSADWIGRRLASLRKIGILDLKTEHVGQRYHTYGKLSELYWSEVEKAKKAVEEMKSAANPERDRTPAETNPERDPGPGSRGEDSRNHDSIKNHEETDAPPLSAAGDAPSNFTEDPTVDVPSEEILAAATESNFTRDQLAERQRIIEMNARLIGERPEPEEALKAEAV